jgi:hypothetical protein
VWKYDRYFIQHTATIARLKSLRFFDAVLEGIFRTLTPEESGAPHIMTIGYAHEKLMDAIYSLATGAGRIQERLGHAAQSLIRLKPDDFPDEHLRRSFNGIVDDLTYEPPQTNEGSIAASLRVTDDEDARAIASRIVALYHAVGRLISER